MHSCTKIYSKQDELSEIFNQQFLDNAPKNNPTESPYRTTFLIISDASGFDEKLPDGLEGALPFDPEVEVLVGEHVDDVVDDWLVHILNTRTQHLANHRARHGRHLPPRRPLSLPTSSFPLRLGSHPAEIPPALTSTESRPSPTSSVHTAG